MKIILPVHHFPPTFYAGAELYTQRLARQLNQLGHDVEVVCIEAIDHGNSDELSAEHHIDNGVGVWRLSMNLLASSERTRWNYDNPLLRRWFDDYFARRAPDLVHLQAGYLLGVAPLESATSAGIPTVLTLHDYWYLCPRITLLRGDGSLCEQIPDDPAVCAWCLQLSRRSLRLGNRASGGMLGAVARSTTLRREGREMARRRTTLEAALAKPQVVVALSQYLAQRFAPYVAPERLVVARCGLDLAAFEGIERRTVAKTLRIGFIGQIAPHKGVHLLVEAFRKLETRDRLLELHIYGGLEAQPSYVARLRRMAGADTRIHFHGRVAHNQAPRVLAQLDVTVTPSTWYENSPVSIMEAHAVGTPVVTAALGGMAELVRPGVDGLHFTPGDVRDLTRQLQRLVDEATLLQALRDGIVPPRSLDDEMRHLANLYAAAVSRQASDVAFSAV